MTGFGRGSAELGDGRVVLEIKSVNHRFLEIRTKAPRELLSGEVMVEQLLRRNLARGFCNVNLWYEGNVGGMTAVDKRALKAHLESLVEVAGETELCLTDLVPVLAGAPDLFATPLVEDEEQLARAIETAFLQASDALIGMREAEGGAMAKEFSKRLDDIKKSVSRLGELAGKWPKTAFERIRERLALLGDGGLDLNQGRMEAEVALLVERADITEEITRLKSHITQAASLVRVDQPVGRKAEFLIQEMGREANTIASKTQSPEISALIINLKTELEKMRELAQNVE
jgi:uncharacterized protein (TIGR00255 family)